MVTVQPCFKKHYLSEIVENFTGNCKIIHTSTLIFYFPWWCNGKKLFFGLCPTFELLGKCLYWSCFVLSFGLFSKLPIM